MAASGSDAASNSRFMTLGEGGQSRLRHAEEALSDRVSIPFMKAEHAREKVWHLCEGGTEGCERGRARRGVWVRESSLHFPWALLWLGLW